MDDDYGDLTEAPRDLIETYTPTMVEHMKHVIAKCGLLITGSAVPVAWLVNIDILLRLVLTGVGIVAGIYSLLYYRKALKKLK